MSNDPTVPPTQPTIETVLEGMNALGEALGAKIDKVRDDLSAEIQTLRVGQERLSTDLHSFREEVFEKFSQVNNKLEVLAEEWLEMRAGQKRQGKRIDELERKAS